MRPLLVVDLCCGLKGASAAMRERGWEVITVDVDERFEPTVVADLETPEGRAAVVKAIAGRKVDLVWASPTCTEFSRESMPWCKTGVAPSMKLVESCVELVREISPRFWLIENVQGAIKYFAPLLGEPRYRMRPMFLWGCGPVTFQPPNVRIWKKQHTGGRADLKSMIPWHLSLALARAVESDKGDRRRRAQLHDVEPRRVAAPGSGKRGRAELGKDRDRGAAANLVPSRAAEVDEGEQRQSAFPWDDEDNGITGGER